MLLGEICEYVSLSPYGFVFFELKEFLSFFCLGSRAISSARKKKPKKGKIPEPNFVEIL